MFSQICVQLTFNGIYMVYFQALLRNLPGGTEANRINCQADRSSNRDSARHTWNEVTKLDSLICNGSYLSFLSYTHINARMFLRKYLVPNYIYTECHKSPGPWETSVIWQLVKNENFSQMKWFTFKCWIYFFLERVATVLRSLYISTKKLRRCCQWEMTSKEGHISSLRWSGWHRQIQNETKMLKETVVF
jgi:hypothetical protein